VKKDKLIVVAHHDVAGKLSKDLRGVIDSLRREDFADLILVSTGLEAADYRDELRGVRVIVRENVGYDFYSWRHGMSAAAPEDYREVILFNTSFNVVDPLKFRRLLRDPMPEGSQVRGLTVSWEKSFHAQSYFLQFANDVVRSDVFRRFWREMQPISDRQAVIDRYEIGLSRELSREFKIGSIVEVGPYEKFLLLRRVLKDPSVIDGTNVAAGYERLKGVCNPSLLLWECLLVRYGIVKKQLVQVNPFNLPIDELKQFIGVSLV